MNWGWPQFVYAALVAVSVGINIARYGEPKRDSYDLGDVLIAPGITIWLLYMGGFWTPGQ